ncbi:MAG: 4'-phosphopantetheinyl transferase superfamily protein [Bacteroidales bacterium]|nr:4'-phosphopantetheinyl transferase superfamily protein [Bacteroidales bacterium]
MPDLNIIFEKISNDYILKVAEFKQNSEFLFSEIKNDLSRYEAENFHKIKNEKRKKEWLATRILLKEITGKYTEIKYNTSGKPYLKRGKYISITHTGNYAGIILSKNENPGIDIEIISDRILKTASKFITEEELKTLKTTEEIYIYWCGKETLFKIKGGGGYDFKKHFNIEPFKIKNKGILKTEIIRDNKEEYTLSYMFKNKNNSKLLIVWKG